MNEWLSVASCLTHLALAVLAVMSGARSSITLPFAFLCLDFFAWNFASLAYDVSGSVGWFYLERGTSPFCTPLALHLLVAFTGRLRRLRVLVVLTYVAFAALSIPAFLAFGVESARAFATSRAWAGIHLAGAVVAMSYAGWLLSLQMRPSFAPVERASTRLVLLALNVGALLTWTELVADLGLTVPRLGHVGSMCAIVVMGVAVLRFRLFGYAVSWLSGLQAVAIGGTAIVAYLAVFSLLGGSSAMVVWGTATVTLGVVLATRASATRLSESRQRVEHLATLGRFSAQMSHDLKNPLAALKGAVQFLIAEREVGRPIEEHDEFMELLVEQIERMDRIVDQYQRIGRVEPIKRRTQINAVIRSVLALHAFSGLDKVEVHTNLCEGLPECHLDEDLLAGALENLIRNAVEAMPEGGRLTVETTYAGEGGGPAAIIIGVEDTGEGMDVRVKEQAFDDFYTTKASGSGLGLAFVRRVAEAHGATVDLTTARGRGTTVRIRLPIQWDT